MSGLCKPRVKELHMEFEARYAGVDDWPQYARILVVGSPGVGKTTLASRFPNPLWVNCKAGTTTLARLGMPYVNVATESELFSLRNFLALDADEREAAFGRPVDTLVIDTVDELQRLLLVDRLKSERRTEAKLEDFGWLSTRFHAIFEGLTQLPVHLVFVAHSKDVNMGDTVIFKPALQGQFAEHIHQYVDMSLRLRASTGFEPLAPTTVRVLSTNDDGDVVEREVDAEWQPLQKSEPTVFRWLEAFPTAESDWVNDKTGQLSMTVDVQDREDLWNEEFAPIFMPEATQPDLPESLTFTVSYGEKEEATEALDDGEATLEGGADDTVNTTEPAEEEVAAEYTCSVCNEDFDTKVWAQLSEMTYKQVMCGPCFREAQGKTEIS